ncbi:MAG: DUF1428 domain-containing protein [Pseudomonadota bacterium]
MPYIDGFVAAVPTENRDAFIAHAKRTWPIFQELGALAQWEGWGDQVPDGELTSFGKAVQAKEDETVVFSWVAWPDQATRDAGWEKMMSDPTMEERMGQMPFDGKRMIFGGFTPIFMEGMGFEAKN